MVNYWPTQDMDAYLNLQSRVQSRMALADITASGDEDPFDEAKRQDAAKLQLSFRDAQLLKLRQEVLSLEDFDDPAMGDFTLDHFFAQLLRYLERNRDALEAMPPGVYAVAPRGRRRIGTSGGDISAAPAQRRGGRRPPAGRQPGVSLLFSLHPRRWHHPLRLRQRPGRPWPYLKRPPRAKRRP